MKQSKHSNTTIFDKTRDSSSKLRDDRNPIVPFFQKRIVKISLFSFGFALLITVYLLANKSMKTDSADFGLKSGLNTNALEIEVLDGTGNKRVAQYLTNAIRSYGYDVVEMKRNSDGVVERTYVIDRSGNLEETRKFSEALGVQQDKVFQKIDPKLYLDITIVVGKDFKSLKAFQSNIERKKH